MKTQKTNRSPIKWIVNFIGKIAAAMVSGLPRKKIIIAADNKMILQLTKQNVKPIDEKHSHRPVGKPVVEKQTLLKEKKKVKSTY